MDIRAKQAGVMVEHLAAGGSEVLFRYTIFFHYFDYKFIRFLLEIPYTR
jgi:hypothetical protein